MKFLQLLAITAFASAVPLPDAELGSLEERNASPCTTASPSSVAAAKAAFTSAKLVPDLIPSFNPDVTVSASYSGVPVKLGNTFNTIQTLQKPNISFTAEPGHDASTTKYTIFLLDPDAPGPSAPVLKDFLHLITYNAQPDCVKNQSPVDIAMYMSPTPLSVAPHRYTFLVYRQPPNYVPPPDVHYAPGVRNNFDLNAYVAEAGLQGPVGGNFYREGLAQDICLVTPGCTSS